MTSTAVYLPHLDEIRAWLDGERAGWDRNVIRIPVMSKPTAMWDPIEIAFGPEPNLAVVLAYRRTLQLPGAWTGERAHFWHIPVATPAPMSDLVLVSGEPIRRDGGPWYDQPQWMML